MLKNDKQCSSSKIAFTVRVKTGKSPIVFQINLSVGLGHRGPISLGAVVLSVGLLLLLYLFILRTGPRPLKTGKVK